VAQAASAAQAGLTAAAPAPAAAPAAAPVAAHASVKAPAHTASVHASAGAKSDEEADTPDAEGELSAVASALHMALADLKSGLAAGKSIAQIASSAGVDPAKLIATVVDDATRKINAAVALHKLARAQADKIIAMLPGLVSDVVNHSFADIGAGLADGSKLPASLGDLASFGNFANFGKVAHLGDFTKIGNMNDLPGMGKLHDIGDFKSFFSNMFGSFGNVGPEAPLKAPDNGKTNPGANIDPQALISSIVSMATDAVNAAVSAGLLSQAQASTILAELTPAITKLVHTVIDASSNLENQAAGWASLGSAWMTHLHH